MEQDFVKLSDHAAVLRRRWKAVAFCIIIAVGISVALSLSRPSMYQAQSELLLQPDTPAPTSTGKVMDPDEVATQADVVGSVEVATRVIAKLGLNETPTQLLKSVTVAVVDTKRVVTISALQKSPTLAAQVANAFGEEYIAYRVETANGARDALRKTYDTQLAAIRKNIAGVDGKIAQLTAGDPRLTSLLNQEQALRANESGISTALLSLDTASVNSTPGGELLRSASEPQSRAQPRPIRAGILGGVVGLIFGIGLAYLRDQFDDGVRDEARLREAMGDRPILGEIPYSGDEGRGRVATLLAPWSPLSEAFRTLNSNVRFLVAARGTPRAIGRATAVLVTSAGPGEGKTSVCTNLAVAAARAGLRVILVDADLRHPNAVARFGLDVPVGLSDLLAEDLPVTSNLHDVGVDNLRLLSAGRVPPNPAELLASPRMRGIFDQLADDADLIIVDSAPVLNVADTLELVRTVDLILVVAKRGVSRLRSVHTAAARIRQVGGSPAGAVLNHAERRRTSYGYGNHPDQSADPKSRRFRRTPRESAAPRSKSVVTSAR